MTNTNININIEKNIVTESALKRSREFLQKTLTVTQREQIQYLEEFASEWFDAKEDFIEMFGGKTSIEREVECDVDSSLYLDIVTDFENTLQGETYTVKREKYEIKKIKYCTLFENFTTMLRRVEYDDKYSVAKNIMSEHLANQWDFEKIVSPLGLDAKKFVGMKLSKVFVQLMKKHAEINITIENDDDKKIINQEIDIISQAFSRVIEQLKTATKKQTIVLSCDLVDYLSMSYGNNWDSCHKLFNLHSQGALAYALNKNVLIAYTKNENNEFMKNWRQVVYCDAQTGFAIGSRNYPSTNTIAADNVRNMWQTAFNASENTDNFKFTRNSEKFANYINTENSFAYIDLSHYSNLKGVWGTWDVENEKNEITVCDSEILCLKCGEWHDEHSSNSVTCASCSSLEYCEDCGDYHDLDYMTYVDGVGYICNECLNYSYIYCDYCNEYHHYENCSYVEDSNEHVCESCLELNFHYCEHCGNWHSSENTYDVENYGNVCQDCIENFEYCEDCERYFQPDDANYYSSLEKTLCDDCVECNYTYCEECEEYHENYNVAYYDELGMNVCDNCYEEKYQDEIEDEE